MTEDRRDFLAAFAIGAIVGIGATLLLAPPKSGAKRFLYEIEPALDRARKGTRRVRKEAKQVAREFGKRGRRAARAVSDEAWRSAQNRVRKARTALRTRS
jgi:gas vesicle protein